MFVETQRINYSLIKSIKSLKYCNAKFYHFHCILIMIYHLITKEMQNVDLQEKNRNHNTQSSHYLILLMQQDTSKRL